MTITKAVERRLLAEFEVFAAALLDARDTVDYGPVAEVRGLIGDDGVASLTMLVGGVTVTGASIANGSCIARELLAMTHRAVEALSA